MTLNRMELPSDVEENILEAADCIGDDQSDWAPLWDHPAAMCIRVRDIRVLAEAIRNAKPPLLAMIDGEKP